MEQELPSSPAVLIPLSEKQTVMLIYRVEEEKEMHPHLDYSSLSYYFPILKWSFPLNQAPTSSPHWEEALACFAENGYF